MSTILTELINLDKILPTLPIVTIGDNKIPLGKDWQHRPFTARGLAELIQKDQLILPTNNGDRKFTAKGFGILTGYAFQHKSENYKILAIDCDGQPAIDLLNRLSGNYQLPETVSWTSGRTGRYQLGYLIPQRFWSRVKTIKINTGEKEVDKQGKEKPVLLEFRWEGLQSVLPPSVHPETGCYKWINSPFNTEFAEFPEWGYKMIESNQETADIKELHSQNQISNPLWSDRDWAQSYCSSINLSNHDWFDYRNILFALHSIGYSESEAIAFSRTSSKHTDHGFYQIWGKNGELIKNDACANSVTIRTLCYFAKQNGWQSPFKGKSNNNGSSYNSPLQKKNEKELQKEKEAEYKFVYAEVEKLVKSNLSQSQITIELKRIADNSSFTLNEVKQLFREIDEEVDSKDKKESAISEFEEYYERKKFEINLYKIFPKALAQAFYAQADKLRTDPVRFAHLFWSAIGCLWGSKVEIRIEDDLQGRSEWSEYPVFFTADVDAPSSKKSVVFSKIFEFIEELQKDEELRLQEAREHLEEVEAIWDRLSSEEKTENRDNPDVNPKLYKKTYLVCKKYLFTNPTIEATMKLMSQQKLTKGCVWAKDEITGLFQSFDQYKSGSKGDARQQILTAWNGKLKGSYERVDESKSYYLNGQTLSVHGGIQQKLLNKYLDLKNDDDGLVSRFLFLNPRKHPKFSEYNRTKVDIQTPLEHYYRLADNFDCEYEENGKPKRAIARFTNEAFEYFISQVERYRRLQEKNEVDNPSYASYIGKMISYIARIAFGIHSTWFAFENKKLLEIDLQSLTAAVEFTDFYLNQFLMLQGITDKSNDGKLDALLRDIWELCKSLGKYQTRDIIRKFAGRRVNGQKMNAKLALECLQQLSDMGYGHLEGKTLYYLIPEGSPKQVEQEQPVIVEEKPVELLSEVVKEKIKVDEVAEPIIQEQSQPKEIEVGDDVKILGEKLILPADADDIIRVPSGTIGKLREFSQCVTGKLICIVQTIVNDVSVELRLFREEISSP